MDFRNKAVRIDTESEKITVNVLGEDMVFDISEKAMKQREAEYLIEKKNMWKQISNPDDRYNMVTSPEQDMVGFYGQKRFSKNGKFCVVFSPGNSQVDRIGIIALVDIAQNKIAYKTRIGFLDDVIVSNVGYLFYTSYELERNNFILSINDEYGDYYFEARTNALLDKICFSDSGKFLAFTTHSSKFLDSNCLFVFDVEAKKVTSQQTISTYAKELYFEGEKLKIIIN
jgi:hypothetical protein